MPIALPLVTAMLLSAPGGCFLVTNTRIVLVPSCDFSPSAVTRLARESESPDFDVARVAQEPSASRVPSGGEVRARSRVRPTVTAAHAGRRPRR